MEQSRDTSPVLVLLDETLSVYTACVDSFQQFHASISLICGSLPFFRIAQPFSFNFGGTTTGTAPASGGLFGGSGTTTSTGFQKPTLNLTTTSSTPPSGKTGKGQQSSAEDRSVHQSGSCALSHRRSLWIDHGAHHDPALRWGFLLRQHVHSGACRSRRGPVRGTCCWHG